MELDLDSQSSESLKAIGKEIEGECRRLEGMLFLVRRKPTILPRNHGFLKYIKPWSSPSTSSRGSFLTFLFCTIYYHTAEVLRSFPSQSLPHFHSALYSWPSPSAYNYHLSILISFQAAYMSSLLLGYWLHIFWSLNWLLIHPILQTVAKCFFFFFCFYTLLGMLYSVLFSLACLFSI